MCEFDACERDTAILRAHAPFVSPPPVRPSLLPAWLERRVRHALRLPALPAARAGLLQLHDAEHDAFSEYEAITPVLDGPAPRTSPHVRYIAQTPYHAHALSTRPPCTSYTTGRRRCPSSARAPTGTTTIFSGDTPECSPRAPARTRTHRTGDVQHQPMRPFPVHSTIAYTAFLASRRSPSYHSHHCPRAQRLRSLFFIASPELRRLRRRPSASLGCRRRRSTSTPPTPCLRTLGARRAAPPACAVLAAVRI
ncbi:hypothetical protein DFH08DRAFT_329487 [Mycena albidolilacea]|uniref:Uncharacterized protein n=1 Tax=Mycena albidolilacea TaxID=1033008 RepID=A0AAD7F3K2_9AGAR|nr:hypothetical protein DFH08DRAFT_329487 [Mycena albidolilacea]